MTTTTNVTARRPVRSARTSVRGALRERREARHAHKPRPYLGIPTAPADLDDFIAAVHRHAGTNARDLRAVLASNLGDYQRTPRTLA